MGKETLGNKIRRWVSAIGWILFLWGIGKTAEEYWKEIQLQENAFGPLDFKPIGPGFVGEGILGPDKE